MSKYAKQIAETPFTDNYNQPHQNGPDYVVPSNSIRTWLPDGAVPLHITNETADWKPTSLVTCFNKTVEQFPNHVALTVKRNNKLNNWTWTQYQNDVKTAAKGFIKLGLVPFHGVGILGFNAPEWFISSLAAIFVGGLSTGIYATNSPEVCYHTLNDCAANIVVVEDDHQLQKILLVKHKLPHLKAIVQYTGNPTEPEVLSWQDLLLIGRSVSEDVLDRRIKGLAVNQCCCLIYTSGTTSLPKGVMLSQDNLIIQAKTLSEVYNSVATKDRILSYLPLSHIAAFIGDIIMGIISVATIHFASHDALKGKLLDSILSANPTIFFGVPRVFEKMCEKLADVEAQMSAPKKKIFHWARAQALKHHTKINGNSESLSFKFANNIVLDKVKRAIGFQSVRICAIGSASFAPEILNYLFSLNIFVTEGYGLSESGGMASTNTHTHNKIGSIGKKNSLPIFDIKIFEPDKDGIGEIILSGRCVFMGYLNLQEQTEEALDDNRYLHTGDLGRIDDDEYLFITGRIKELVITSGGENIPPNYIENIIKDLIPAISQCMVVGDKKKYLTMLITLKTNVDMETMTPTNELSPITIRWCRSLGSEANTVSQIINNKDEAVYTGIQSAIDSYNNNNAISNAQKIQKWIILPKDFSLAGGELGPTAKMKRYFIADKYSDIIDKFYS